MTSNNKPIKIHSWALVIFLLIIFWPVGVYFLIRKLSGDKKASLSSGRKMAIWGWIIAGMGIISWTSLMEDGFIDGTLGMLFFVSLGLILVYLGKKSLIIATKYKKYIDLIVNRRLRSIAAISSAIPVSHDSAIKDIKEMIDKGFFEDAYINYNLDEIVFSEEDEADERVKKHRVDMIVVPCNGCGANNKVEKGRVEHCQYCGSLIGG